MHPKRCAGRSKKRAEAVAEKVLVHSSAGQRRLRAQHGRRAGSLPASPGRPLPGGLRFRDQLLAGLGNARTAAAGTRPAGPLRLRVPAPRGLQPVYAGRTPAGLAHGPGHGPAHQAGLRRGPARPGGHALSAGREGGSGLRQPQHASPQRALRGLPPAEARRLAARLEWHYTPKHGSWLNIAEIEFAALAAQCLDRRIASEAVLEAESAAWARPCTGSSQPRTPASNSCICTLLLSEVGPLVCWPRQWLTVIAPGSGQPRPLTSWVVTPVLRRSPNSCGDLKSELARPGRRSVCTGSLQASAGSCAASARASMEARAPTAAGCGARRSAVVPATRACRPAPPPCSPGPTPPPRPESRPTGRSLHRRSPNGPAASPPATSSVSIARASWGLVRKDAASVRNSRRWTRGSPPSPA